MLPVDKKPNEIFVNYDLVNRNLQRTAVIQYKMQNKAFFKEKCQKILPNDKKVSFLLLFVFFEYIRKSEGRIRIIIRFNAKSRKGIIILFISSAFIVFFQIFNLRFNQLIIILCSHVNFLTSIIRSLLSLLLYFQILTRIFSSRIYSS